MTLNSFLIHANSDVTAPPLCDHLLHMQQQAHTCCAGVGLAPVPNGPPDSSGFTPRGAPAGFLKKTSLMICAAAPFKKTSNLAADGL